jgi:hypothetical protein
MQVEEQIKKEFLYERVDDDDVISNSYELSDEAVARIELEIQERIEGQIEYEDDFEDVLEHYDSFYFKYLFEGCSTIDDIISQLTTLKNMFEQYKEQGHDLVAPVDSGYCFIDAVLPRPAPTENEARSN